MGTSKNKPIALVFGASGKIGFACAEILAKNDFNLILIHRDSKSKLDKINRDFGRLSDLGSRVYSLNVNVTSTDNVEKIVDFLQKNEIESINAFIHAIADANIGNMFSNSNSLTQDGFLHTANSMSVTFATWSQVLLSYGFLKAGSRIIGFTSEGSSRILKGYAAAGAAKAHLETICKYMAIELAAKRITVNLINAGIIESNALCVIPDSKTLLEKAAERNPMGRLTNPSDIAKVVAFLASDDSAWITGEVIRVDGGEQLLGLFS